MDIDVFSEGTVISLSLFIKKELFGLKRDLINKCCYGEVTGNS